MPALWSGTGPLGSWYAGDGGPLELWRELAPGVTGHAVDGGHFFPEERPTTRPRRSPPVGVERRLRAVP
jgi:haloacetate dehalogenase